MSHYGGGCRERNSASDTAWEDDSSIVPTPESRDELRYDSSRTLAAEDSAERGTGPNVFSTLDHNPSLTPTDSDDDSDSWRFRTPSLHNGLVHFKSCQCGAKQNHVPVRAHPTRSSPMGVPSVLRTETNPCTGCSQKDPEKAIPNPPAAVGFWHSGLSKTRKEVFRKYAETLLILCVAIMAILSIYWGVLFDVKQNLHHATVAVVSFEGLAPYESYTPIVTPFIQSALEQEVSSRRDHLGFQFRSPAEFDNDPMRVRLAVFNEECWAAIIINSNATALLTEAIATGNSSYDPRGAASMIYNQARDIESYNFYIVPVLDRLALQITTTFATFWATRVLSNTSYTASTYARSPQALSPGISFTQINLRPFDPPVAIPTITIGLIYLIIIAFFSFTFFIPTHMKFVLPNRTAPHPPLKFYQLIIYRWCATMTAYLFLSLSYSLVSLAFQTPFSNSPPAVPSPLNNGDGHWSPTEPVAHGNYLGHATFVVYWLLNWVGMAALGITCENAAMFLTSLSPLPFSALFLIWWVITNVSTGFYAIELASDFYRWGFAWPLRHIVMGSKTLVFGTRSALGLNFGVLFAWVAVGSILFPLACWVMRWKSIKDRKAQDEAVKTVQD